jgi:acyl transferase domain-containing protein
MSGPQQRQQPIAVVGVSTLMPGSQEAAGFWRTVVEGRDLIREVPETHWLVEDYYDPDPAAPDKAYARRGSFLDPVDFDPLAFGVPPNALPATDTSQLLALVAAAALLADVAGSSAVDRSRTGVILGAAPLELLASMGNRLQRPVWLKALRDAGIEESVAQDVCERIAAHYVPWQEESFPGLLSNVITGRIANRFDLGGTNHTVDAACASSLAAVSSAVAELSLGRADLMITGGVDTLNDVLMYMCFSKTPALSPTGDARPLSDRADGTILGEGIAMLALKRLADARRDADHVYAVIRGIGSSSDGRGGAIYAPVAKGQASALRRAYAAAGYGPETVELVEAHGTGTTAGDAVELTALGSVFAETGRTDGPWCAVGSVKSQFGHTKAAAGAVGLVKAVLALHHKVLPPTIKVDRPSGALDQDGPLYVNTEARPWIRDARHPRRASVSSFGFGGTNFHLTLEEHAEAPRRPDRTAAAELVLLSAASADDLVADFSSVLTADPATVARRTQADFRPTDPVRLAIVATGTADLADKLDEAAGRIRLRPADPFTLPNGVCYATGTAAAGKVAFLFPGQGSQYVGMGADLAMQLPEARSAWDGAAELTFAGRGVHQLVFPVPAFTAAERAAQQAALTATEWAQPALAVQSLALLNVLRALRVAPDCVAGHSFGELVALHAAGAFDQDTLVRLGRRRGELMRGAAGARAGAMLAVSASKADAEQFIADSGLEQLWPANHNAPTETVLSGSAAAIDALAGQLTERRITVRRLNAATAFHSPLVADASAPLLEFLRELPVESPRLDTYGNADAARYPRDPDQVRERIAEQLSRPVRFAEQIEAMYAEGVRTFVEVGAGSVLTGLVGRILTDRPHLAVSLDRRQRHGLTTLFEALGQLAVAGVPVDFAALWAPEAEPAADSTIRSRTKPGMTVPLLGTNYGKPYPPAGGAASLPPPNPERPAPADAPVTVTTAGVAVQSTPDRPAPADDEWLRVFQEVHRQTAQVHGDYQRLMAESHLAYLRSVDGLLGNGTTPLPTASTPSVEPAPTWTPAPAPPEFPLPRAPELDVPVPVPVPVPLLAVAAPVAPADIAPPALEPAGRDLSQHLLAAVAEATGYPPAMLDIGMELEADLGIDSIKRVQILANLRNTIPDLPEVDVAELGRLRTLDDIVHQLSGATEPAPEPEPEPPSALTTTARPLARGVVRAVPTAAAGSALRGLGGGRLVVTDDGSGVAGQLAAKLVERGLDAIVAGEVPADAWGVILLGGLRDGATVDDATAVNREAFGVARTVASGFTERGGVFVTVQDTGGDFGLAGREPDRAWLGGVAALARTAAKEWPGASVKAIDCARGDRHPESIAEAIVNELINGGDTLDVGLLADGTRLTLDTVATPIGTELSPLINRDSVLVATGGARGVTAAGLRALAEAHAPKIVLIGRTELTEEPAELHALTDESALRRAVADRATRRGDRLPTPAEVGAEVRELLAAREIRDTIGRLERAGSTVRYVALDIRDADALDQALVAVRADWGPITGIVHGAGVLADKYLADKSDAQFDHVFDTKVAGLRALLAATADDPIDVLCVFSSVAGRFGNVGQSDYAMANEVLSQVASAEQVRRPGCRVRSIAWGPWHGGMVDEALAARFESLGVPLIPPVDGAAAFVAELDSGTADVQVVLTAGDPDRVWRANAARDRPTEHWISAASHPYLVDHVVAEQPVLPMALAIEWFARALRHQNPIALRDIAVLRKVELAGFADGTGHLLRIRTNSAGTLELISDDADTLHYRAEPGEVGAEVHGAALRTPLGTADPLSDQLIYDGHVLFHGPAFQAITSIETLSPAGADATVVGISELGWSGTGWVTDPAAVDGGLQVAVRWAAPLLGGASLPMKIGGYRGCRRGAFDGPVRCRVRAREVNGYQAGCDIGFFDADDAVRAELLDVTLVRRP